MPKWEYLEVVRTNGGLMFDSTGRYWGGNRVKSTVGTENGWRGEKAIEWAWGSASGLIDLGVEGWELVGVVPASDVGGGVHISDSPNTGFSGSLLIFKRPKA
jgi:hypothetical protein